MNNQELINKERLKNTFLKLVQIDSGSSENGRLNNIPSTSCQLELAQILAEILNDIGLEDVNIDEFGILTATLNGNIKSNIKIGLIAHMDTSDVVLNKNVKPIVHCYISGDIELKNAIKIESDKLEKYKNNTIITSDGSTLLGADDKAGIAEIIEALYIYKENPNLLHPTIKIAFTPDEEIGYGTENFDIEKFGANYAYTLDGDEPQTIDTETFNAYNPEIIIYGNATHTGYAYQKMINSISVANYILNQLPNEKPETTKNKEGFYHIDSIEGNVAKTTIKLLVRDFDSIVIKNKIEFLKNIVNNTKERFKDIKIEFIENKKYQNMKIKLDETPKVVKYAKLGIQKSGLNPFETFVRGGTDGAELTYMGLPCPNLGCGAENYHSLNEFVSLETMAKCSENIINIMSVWVQNYI